MGVLEEKEFLVKTAGDAQKVIDYVRSLDRFEPPFMLWVYIYDVMNVASGISFPVSSPEHIDALIDAVRMLMQQFSKVAPLHVVLRVVKGEGFAGVIVIA